MSEGEKFLAGGVCMRSVLDLMMDGTVRRGGCLDGKEELCRVCWEMRGGVDVMEREGLVKEVVIDDGGDDGDDLGVSGSDNGDDLVVDCGDNGEDDGDDLVVNRGDDGDGLPIIPRTV